MQIMLLPSAKGTLLHLLVTAHKCSITGRAISLSLKVLGMVKRLKIDSILRSSWKTTGSYCPIAQLVELKMQVLCTETEEVEKLTQSAQSVIR